MKNIKIRMESTATLFVVTIVIMTIWLSSCQKEEMIIPKEKLTTWDVVVMVENDTIINESSFLVQNRISGNPLPNGEHELVGEKIKFPNMDISFCFFELNLPDSENTAYGNLQGKFFTVEDLHNSGDTLITGTEKSTISICGGPQNQRTILFCKKRKEISCNPRLLKSGVFISSHIHI